jgi:hypothetical protein
MTEEKKMAYKPNPQLNPDFYQSKGYMQGGDASAQSPAKIPERKIHIGREWRDRLGTNEIRLIVSALNNPPFTMALSLVSFDEKAP